MALELSRWTRAGITAGALALAAVGWAGPGRAQGVVKSTHGEWQLRCETPAGAKNEQCALVQNVAAQDRPNARLLVIQLKTARRKSPPPRVVPPPRGLLPAGPGPQRGPAGGR